MAGSVVLGLGFAAMLAVTTGEGGTAILHDFPRDIRHPSAPLVADGLGNLFGTTLQGGAGDLGTVFRVRADGSGFVVLHSFVGGTADGSSPYTGLLADGAGNLYGTTYQGGASNLGTVFTIKPDGSGYTVLHSFFGGSAGGANPLSGLVTDGGTTLFGTTQFGGASNLGTVFTIKTDGSGFALLSSLAGVFGSHPRGNLLADGAGNLFGTTPSGGYGAGTVFTIKTDGSGFTLLHAFPSLPTLEGAGPNGDLVADGAGNLYGTAYAGGALDLGTVFTIRTDGTGFAVLRSFAGGIADGSGPHAGLLADGAGNLYGTTVHGGASDAGTVFRIAIDGSAFAVVHSFTGAPFDGAYPEAGLVADPAGGLYGTTEQGGSSGSGTVFRLETDGSGYSLVYSFEASATDGTYPWAGLLSDGAGNLYGTTWRGGASGCGTVYTVRNDGSGFSLLHSFACSPNDGRAPLADLISDGNGNLYGTTGGGGARDIGTVFTIRTDGSGYMLLHSFAGGATDGAGPQAGLLADGAGFLYGTTNYGGASDRGTIFKVKVDGTDFALLYTFTGGAVDGRTPWGGLVSDGTGGLYGTLYHGGLTDSGRIYTIKTDGTGFAVLHSFAGGATDGRLPLGRLVIDGTDLYGTTVNGGDSDEGTVFTLKTDGSGFGLLHSFAGGVSDGRGPSLTLLADGVGNLYGMTGTGGTSDLGTVYTLKSDGTGFTLLHSFAGPPSDGSYPRAALVRRGRTLYGTTTSGGVHDGGTVFALVNPLWKGSDTPGIYRDSDRQWYLKNSNAPGFSDLEFPYGDPSDLAVVGDWDGDGIDTVGIYRGNTFYLRNSNTAGNADLVIEFGAPGDVPIAGDWDGDGIDTIGVYRPGDAAWFLKNSNAAGAPDLAFTYGLENETPVVGDWNADGIDTVGIFRASDRQWYLHNANASGDAELVFPYGDPATDVPIVGDWDNDGTDTVGVYRPAQGEWFLKNTNAAGNADLNFTYGILNEKPVVGDWDGN
jgi:uncharacterized repeat protein (TIGR03803 family)